MMSAGWRWGRGLHVEDVVALAGEDGTVVAGDIAVGTAAVKGHTADAAHVVAGHIPHPHGHRIDALHLDLHPVPRQWCDASKQHFSTFYILRGLGGLLSRSALKYLSVCTFYLFLTPQLK
jgi:hypothetical protein